jgi:hypothetical protein
MGGEASADGVQIGWGWCNKILLAFGDDLIGNGFQRLAIRQNDVALPALIGMGNAFLLIQCPPAGFGDFQDNAFNIPTKARLEIQHTAATTAPEKIKSEPRIGQDAGADGLKRRRIMAMARAPGAPIFRIRI